MYHINWKSFDR